MIFPILIIILKIKKINNLNFLHQFNLEYKLLAVDKFINLNFDDLVSLIFSLFLKSIVFMFIYFKFGNL